MRTALALLACLQLSAPARGAIAYTRFAHPKGEYAIEYPSDWKRSLGLQAVSLRPPGRDGVGTGVALERYPFGKDSPKDPDAFVAALKADTIKKIDSEKLVEAAGRKARRLALTVTAELKGQYGQKLAGPRREVYIVFSPSRDGSFYVLRLAGVGKAFEAALPEFDRVAGKLVLAPTLAPK
ncbi:MAG: hypothetical protein HY077_12130 [Elusimicrobia bacterium]|nr:hypothetical protein [Elusimicrobiota bacterium]